MSAAAKWKMREKEAASAAVAGRTDPFGFKAKKMEPPTNETSCVAGNLECESKIVPKTLEKSAKQETQKPSFVAATNPVSRQGSSKLPVGKETSKISQAKEASNTQVKEPEPPLVNSSVSKIPTAGKDTTSNFPGRRTYGAGLKKEEPAQTSKAKVEVSTNEPRAESDKDPDDGKSGSFGSGRTKGLAGFWATQTDEVKSVKKKRLTAVEDNLTPMVVENTPQQLEGVVRSQDPGEWKKPIQMQEGWTKNVVSSLQLQKQDGSVKKSPIRLIEDTGDEKLDSQNPVKTEAVKVKDISQRLVRQGSETQKPKDKLIIDPSQGSIVLAENQPSEVDPNVVRSEIASEEVVLEKGRTRNLLQHWKNTEVEYNSPKTSITRFQGTKPAWILEIEAAKGNPDYKTPTDEEENDDETQTKDDENNRKDSQTEQSSGVIYTGLSVDSTKNKTKDKVIDKIKDNTRDKAKEQKDADDRNEARAIDVTEFHRDQLPASTKLTNPVSNRVLSLEGRPITVGEFDETKTTFLADGYKSALSVSDANRSFKNPEETESDDPNLNRFKVNDDQVGQTSEIGKVFPTNTNQSSSSVQPSSGFLENHSNTEYKGELATIPSGSIAIEEEFRASSESTKSNHISQKHLAVSSTEFPDTNATEVQTAEQLSSDLITPETDVEVTTKVETFSKSANELLFSTRSEDIKHHIEYQSDSLTLEPSRIVDKEPKSTNVGELEVLVEHRSEGEPSDLAFGAWWQQNPENLEFATDKSENVPALGKPEPCFTPTSEFNLLTLDLPTVGKSDYSPETAHSPKSVDDLLRFDPPSLLFAECADQTPCLVPSGAVEAKHFAAKEGLAVTDLRHDDERQDEDLDDQTIVRRTESPVSEARNEVTVVKKPDEPSQRSCYVM